MSCQAANLEEFELAAVDIAKQAGTLITDTCGNVKAVETKQSFADLVTETDKNVEKFIFHELKSRFPEHRFIGEEGVAEDNYARIDLTDEPTWIVDPVDGKCGAAPALFQTLELLVV